MMEINKKNARIWSMLGMRRVLGMMLEELLKADEKFVFVTADVARYFGTEKYAEEHPEHYIDVGIAEQNMVTVAAGLQKEGMNALAATYSTFVTARALDQIRVSLGYMELPVTLVGVGGGLAEGDLSATHMGLEDIAAIRAIPNITIVQPADCVELVKVLESIRQYNRPIYIRLTGKTNLPRVYTEDYKFEIGKANVLREGKDKIVIISSGTIVASVMKVAESFQEDGIDVTVVDMHTIKPLDTSLLDELANYDYLITVEEHMSIGGLGSAVAEYYASKKEKPQQLIIGVDDFYPLANDYEELLVACGLTPTVIKNRIKEMIQEEN